MATATREKEDVRSEEASRRADGSYVCLITDAHAEPTTFVGKDAKRIWAMHRSREHNIKSGRHEAIRLRAKGKVRRRKPTQATHKTAMSFRVEPALTLRVQFAPTMVAKAEIDADGVLRLYDKRGGVALAAGVGAALR